MSQLVTYSCERKKEGNGQICGGEFFCKDGSCAQGQTGTSNMFGQAVSALAAVAAAGEDVAELNGENVRAFTGEGKSCKKFAAGFNNCCKDSGWGQDVGLSSCSSDEKALGKAKEKKLTVYVGEYCSKKVLGVCLEKKRGYCQFDSKLARIVQEQGRRDQLGVGFGTNYSHREGHMTSQLDSGATKTLTSSGQSVYNTTEAISKLPVDIALGKTASSSWQQQQRDAMSEAQSLSNSLSQTSSLATSQMSQWSQQRGNSDTTVAGSDASTGSNLTKALNTIQSIGSRYARDENVSLAEAVRAAATKSQDMSAGAGGSAQVSFDTDRHIFGKIGGLATGLKGSAEGHLKTEYTGRSGSSHGTSSDLTQQGGTSKGFSAQELKDFRDAMDVVASSRMTDSGSHTDNASASLANQLSSTFSSLKSQASQYNDAVTRSHEYSQLASYAENNSASINQNYSQEFVGYVTSQRPGEADQLLSDAASPEVRAERDRLAQAFVEDRMKPHLLQEFEQNRGRTSEGIGSVGAPSGGGNLQSEYDAQQTQMENRANAGGVRQQDDVSGDVADRRRHAESQVNSEKNTVISSGNTPKEEYNRLQSEHEQGNKNFSDAKSAEEKRQSDKIGDNSIGRNNLNRIKDELQDKFNKE